MRGLERELPLKGRTLYRIRIDAQMPQAFGQLFGALLGTFCSAFGSAELFQGLLQQFAALPELRDGGGF